MSAADWRARAACRGIDLNLFFPSNGSAAGHAGAWCQQCPVKKICLDEAMRMEGGAGAASRYGVYGGLSAAERYTLHRSRRRAAAKAAGQPEEDEQQREHKGRAIAECGTPAAYERHKRNGEPIDEACMANHTRPRRSRKTPPTCGTRRGYRAHRARDEQACDACRDANSAADRRLRNTGTTKVLT